MLTTTTKVINYTIQKGSKQNTVAVTAISTPGFNATYLTQIQGILKLVQFCLAVTGLGLIASRYQFTHKGRVWDTYGDSAVYTLLPEPQFFFPMHMFMNGEVYYICAHVTVLTTLIIFLITYLFSTVSAMVITKTSKLDMVMDVVLGLVLLAAAITQLTSTVYWGYDRAGYGDTLSDYRRGEPLMYRGEYAIRIVAGVVALVNAVLFFVSYAFARRDLYGREPEKAQLNSSLLRRSQRSEQTTTAART